MSINKCKRWLGSAHTHIDYFKHVKGDLTNFAHPNIFYWTFLIRKKNFRSFFQHHTYVQYSLRFANIFLHLLPVFFTAKKRCTPHSAPCYFHLPQRKKEPYTHWVLFCPAKTWKHTIPWHEPAKICLLISLTRTVLEDGSAIFFPFCKKTQSLALGFFCSIPALVCNVAVIGLARVLRLGRVCVHSIRGFSRQLIK